MVAVLFASVFGISLFFLAIAERVLNACFCVFSSSKDLGPVRAQLVVGGLLNLSSSVASSLVSVGFRCFYSLGWFILWYFLLYCVSSIWFVVYEDYPHVVLHFFDFYNKRIGPFVHGYLVLPLEFLDVVLKGVLPLYNASVWFVRSLTSKGFLPLFWDNMNLFINFSLYVLELCQAFTLKVVEFLSGLSCSNLSCLDRVVSLDLMTPMSSVRGVALTVTQLAGKVCRPTSVPVEFVLYPLLDFRFARGVHNLLNSVLYVLVHAPIVTTKRCNVFGSKGSALDVFMCTPDLQPAFDHAVNGFRDFGTALDNWMGVGASLARRSLTGRAEKCDGRPLEPSVFRKGLLLTGRQATVGLTEWTMGVANGSLVYFFGSISTDVIPRPWPEPVDVRFGVAAVSYEEAGEIEVGGVTQGQKPVTRQTSSMLGCRCVDTTSGLVVRCSVVQMGGVNSASTHSFDVFFQDSTWSSQMQCRSVEISVKSLRWPVRRYEGKSVPFAGGYADLPESDCLSRGSCESVDATIWLVPRCDLLRPEQCSNEAVGTSCFPFCMAVRVSGSRNSNPVFVNAETWRKGKQVLMRNCALRQSNAARSTVLGYGADKLSTVVYGKTTLSDAAGGASLYVSGSGDGSECVGGVNMASWIPANSTAVDPRSVPSTVRRRGQPFAIVGDAILIEFPTPDGSSVVEVDRLSGNQKDVYRLSSGWAGLPAAPKRMVPVQELTQEERTRIVVPIDFVTTRVPATSSRNYVFYAVSPDLRIFQAYLDYCRDPNALPQVQFMMLSSYSALRVYRVRAYCQELCEVGQLTAQFTFDGFSDGKFTAANFPQDCSRVYNASVDSLEYVNEQNIAVVVQVADKTYDPSLREGSNSTYVTYWLNPQTMAVRSDQMWPIELPSTLTTELCLASDGVPHLGTMAAEVGVAGLHLLHKVVGGVIYAPGMLTWWRGGGFCPLESRGHSVLATCGENVFSLDDFFDSLDAASAVFWGIPAWFAEQLEQGKTMDYSPVSDLLRGFGAYGRGTVGITEVRGGVLSLLNTPLPEQLAGVYAFVRQPGSLSGAAKVAGAASSWARYSARFFAVVGVQLARKLVAEGSIDVSELWRNMVGALYDQRPFFKSSVTDRAYSACLGLQVMVGGANPFGSLLYHGCLSSALLLDGGMDVFLHLFVDAPVLKCVCKDSEGKLVAKYARDHCVFKAPQTMQPILYGMIASSEASGESDALLCTSVVEYTRKSMEATMKPYFSSVYQSLDALGDLMDYLLSGYDLDAGQCSDFWQDPQVVVIMPEPVDYFQGCGMTTSCKTKCGGNWDAFTAAVSGYKSESLGSARLMAQTVDSMFFPSVIPDMIAPGKVVAITDPHVCGAWVCRSDSDDCLAAASVVGSSLEVSYYCVPSSPASSVYRTEVDGVDWTSGNVAEVFRQVSFFDIDGTSLAVLLDKKIVIVSKNALTKVVLDVDNIMSLPLLGMYPMQLLDFLAVRDKLIVSVAVRAARDGEFERETATLLVEPANVTDASTVDDDKFPIIVKPTIKNLWKGYAVSQYPQNADLSVSRLLFWPLTASGSTSLVTLRWSRQNVEVVSVQPFERSESLVARATLLPRQIVVSKVLREEAETGELVMYATTGAVYDWLRQLRLVGSGLALASATVSNSQPVASNVTVWASCDGLDCRGCPDLKLRSLCSAYQSCAVFRCIGTPVNLKRPLCGVGGALKSLGAVGIENVQGAWVMFVDIYMILLQLKLVPNLPGVDVTFPDDSFMGNICAAKDVSAELISILTSTINSAAQRVHSLTGIFSRANAVDASVNTLLSISTAAVTGFLNQIALAPVYVLSVGHKIMMCQVSGTLALVGKSGFEVNIQPAKFSSTDAISGQCLTRGAEVNSQQTGDPQVTQQTTSQAAEILSHVGTGQVIKRIEPFLHVMDGTLTYFIGLFGKFGEVMQAMDSQHCMLPDVTLKSTVRCACGDRALSIKSERRREKYDKFAYWCSGVLSIPDANNRMRMVWNPYSYEELQGVVGGQLDAYVAAASFDIMTTVPNSPVFAQQGVSMFSVLTRCRQNFINKQWDSAAFARYDAGVMERELKGGVNFVVGSAGDGVGQCLLDSVSSGVGNGACMDAYLRRMGVNDDYWGYTMVSKDVPSHLLDACLVFSGPASNASAMPDRRQKFQECLGGYSDGGACDLSGFVWSPASSNSVPVAERHVIYSGNETHLEDAYAQKMRKASDLVMSELSKLESYENPDLQAAVFSAEGDIIHQLLDCVYMGPYARMDYWPGLKCDETSQPDCLVGPYWSRDSSKGKSRNLDLDTCEITEQLPFTCGSKTRQAMVRDFVKRYLETGVNGADLIKKIIVEWLGVQKDIWWNPSRFTCNCSGCCDGSYLPTNLSNISLQISTKELINALEQRVRSFYRSSMISSEPWIGELDQSELAKYNWTTSEGSHRVAPYALYHPAKPTMSYSNDEALSPPTSFLSPSLWHTCHSALKQIMFTLPVHDNGSLVGEYPEYTGGSVQKITEHVKKLVANAERHSPLFRHYHPKHHPSHSRMCNGSFGKDANVVRGSVTFDDYAVNGRTLFYGSSVPPIPTLGFDAAVLGGKFEGMHAGLNDHLGFMDRSATEDWLNGATNLKTSSDFMMRYGASGLKLGNLPGKNQRSLGLPDNYTGDIDQVLREGILVSDRSVSLDTATLYGCDDHKISQESLLEDFVDSLFPMAQGVRESGVGSYCLRFAVELAMLHAMELLEATPTSKLVAQKDRVVSWRKKCGSQVQIVGMCNALDLYHDGGFTQYSCLHSWQYSKVPGVETYVTPDCLVKIGNDFYDPCQCRPQLCEPNHPAVVLNWTDIRDSDCKMRFDPRSVVQSVELGWWAEDHPDTAAKEWNKWLEDPVNFLNLEALKDGLLVDGTSVGNTPPGDHWVTSEGFLNVTGSFCDMIADYWPDGARFPVGYHVTVPCDSSESGYRTFDNVFVLDTDASGEPVMVFVEDQSRDADLVDSNFGSGGLCRGTNFGFDMYETNTMRVCTRVTDGEDVDIHVPAGKNTRLGIGLPRCSESSRDIPWGDFSFYDYYDAAFYTVGTVPNLPTTSAIVYPEDSLKMLVVGPQHRMSTEGWGAKCQDLVIPNCSESGWSCPENFKCTASGICQHLSVQCTRHSDCPSEMMCTGLGVCKTPVISVENKLGADASFRAHTTDCAGEAFSMRGASHWAYVPDLLESHGMCSYRHWQEYLYTLQKCSCAPGSDSSCVLNAKECPYYVFSNQDVNNRWWNETDDFPTRMKMLPTTCDRDYERFAMSNREMLSCVPVNSMVTMLKQDNTYEKQISRDKMWRLYDNSAKTVRLRQMPYSASKGAGFLTDMNVQNIKSCMSVQQCYVDVFTKNGKRSMIESGIVRADRVLFSGVQYDPNDQFKCGVIGYYDSTLKLCVVDEKVFPLYHVLCDPSRSAVRATCLSSLKSGTIPAKCDSVQKTYSPQYSVINDVNVPALNEFFNVFNTPQNLEEHLSMVECATAIYTVISSPPFDSRGLYYAFSFTLYEIPFSWFYQCNVGSSISVSTDLNKKLYPCTYFANKNSLATYSAPLDRAYTDFKSYIFNVRGGYVRSVLMSELSRIDALITRMWDESVETTRLQLFGSVPGMDLSYPMCYNELRWILPNDDANLRKIIEGFVRNRCSNDLLTRYIQKYNGATKNFNVRTILGEVTRVAGDFADQADVLRSNRILTGFISQFGRSQLAEATKLGNVDLSTTPIQLNYNMPGVDSKVFTLARNAWRERVGVLPNQVDVKILENAQNCEESQLVELYRDSSGYLHENEDTDLVSGFKTTVKTCPVYATGMFSCQYPPMNIPGGSTYSIVGNSGQVEQQYDLYVDAVYSHVKKLYDQKIAALVQEGQIAPFQMSELPFYSQDVADFGENFVFNLQGVANYVNNINPDVRTTVMCTAGNQLVDYNTCNDQNFLALRSHVYASYSRDGGAVVPDRFQMDWSVTRRMMSSGAIFSFASIDRDISKRFIDRLFDPATVCSSGSANRDERLCYFSTVGGFAEPRAITPWMSGWWNPYDKCDVDQMDAQSGNTERIDSYCYYKSYCPPEQGTSTSSVDYYKYMPNNADCILRNNQKTANLNVNSKLLYNLCRHTLNEDSICTHTQGMVGGSDGFPSENYDVGGNLYKLHEFTSIPAGDGQLFGNVLLRGERSDYGFLRFPTHHIAGHHVGFQIDSDSVLRVSKLPLKHVMDKTRIAEWDTQSVKDWVGKWSAGLSEDHGYYTLSSRDIYHVVASDVRGKPILSWDCPLRRRAFYTGSVEGFKPQLPSARRSKTIFGDITNQLFAHPTQVRKDGSVHFGKYKTTNGFCFCPVAEEVWPGMCSVGVDLTTEHNCTLYNTLRAIGGEAWGWSHTFKPRNVNNEYKVCGVQLDWPFVNGTLRDGSTILHDDVDGSVWAEASDVELRRCHVLDRIPDFSYVFVSKRELRKSGFTTLDRGVCHTGRAQRIVKSYQRCVRLSKSDTSVTLRCSNNQEVPVQRVKSASAASSANYAKLYRRYCSKCTKTPKFATRAGKPLTPESSFGVPYRLSSERAVAADLRSALCANKTSCDKLLDLSKWTKGSFFLTLLKDPAKLFKVDSVLKLHLNLTREYLPSTSNPPDDSGLWNKPWVHCPSKVSLKTGLGCNGTISKQRWRNDRVGACYTTMVEAMKGNRDPFASTDICNIDPRLTSLCKVIREAQSLVASANCLKSGDPKCALQEYVYNPSTWETSNKAFVRQTVEEFYKRVDNCYERDGCVCGSDVDLLNLRTKNHAFLKDCNAVPVIAFKSVLIEMRALTTRICLLIATFFDVVFNLILSMSSKAHDAATANLLVAWAKLKQESATITDKVSDMFFNLLFSTGVMGPWLQESVMSACNLMNEAYQYTANTWCNLVIRQFPVFLSVLRSVGAWIDVGFTVVNDVFTVILNNYLPDSLLDLYNLGYNEYFHSTKYREKQQAYERRVQMGLVNPDQKGVLDESSKKGEQRIDNKVLQALQEGRERNMKRTKMTTALNVLGTLSYIGDVINIGNTIYEGVQAIEKAKEMKELLEKFPKSLTLFDFDNFYASIDALVLFFNGDFMCYNIDKNVEPLQCMALNFSTPSVADLKSMAPTASACWAEAQERQVGVSNLYSCSPTSTCCVDPLNCDRYDGSRLCADCPVVGEGVVRYGCNTMIQRCQCGVQRSDVDRCLSQSDCDAKSSCSLLTSLDDVSFGALSSCTECSTSPICLMGGATQYGQCTCLSNADAKVELCDVSSSAAVNPNPSKMCGYSKDYGSVFSWSELSLVRCIYAVRPVCARVWTEDGNVITMPVSNSLRNSQVAYSSRRLLSIEPDDARVQLPSVFLPDDPADDVTPDMIHRVVTEYEWNYTSAPCSSLAHAYRQGQHLGPVDESTLHSCVYWRTVARQIIKENKLTSLAPYDTFLLSPGDFSSALGQKGVLEELLMKPYVLFYALLYSQTLKPLRAALLASHDPNVTLILNRWRDNLITIKEKSMPYVERQAEIYFQNESWRRSPGRRLMSVEEDLEQKIVTLPLYTIVKMQAGNFSVPDRKNYTATELWQSDVFLWPSKNLNSDCAVVETVQSNMLHVAKVLKSYYTHIVNISSVKNRRSRLVNVLPKFGASKNQSSNGTSTKVLSNNVILNSLLQTFDVSMNDVSSFLTDSCPKDDCMAANRFTASYIVESLLFCRLEDVMFCPHDRNELFSTAVGMLILFSIIYIMLNYLGFGWLGLAIFALYLPAVLWYSSGVSFRCAPMIPTCLMSDFIYSIKTIIPASVSVPSALKDNSTKLKSCKLLGFDSWEDPLAYMWCDFGFCNTLNNSEFWGLSTWNFRDMDIVSSGVDSNAYRLCATVTLYNTLPVLLLVTLIFVVFAGFLIGIASLFPPFCDLIWKTLVYNHS